MMSRGKHICKELKSVRKRIAEENGIPLEIPECTYHGPCKGTCPRCEAEVRYLENSLAHRLKMGKVATIAGVVLGLASCGGQTPGVVNVWEVSPPDRALIEDNPDEAGTDDGCLAGVIEEYGPEFPGGMEALYKFLDENIKYPQLALKDSIEGKVYITFVVETDGNISNPRVLRDIGGGCGKEALRVVKMMPKWKPGTQQGTPVRVQFNLPVKFVLPKAPCSDEGLQYAPTNSKVYN